MQLIAAHSQNRVIGRGDWMPWDVPDEYAHYLELIRDKTVLMGRRSYEIFGDDLTSRHAVVVSRSVSELPGATVCPDLESAIAAAKATGLTVCVCGGESIYEQTIPRVDEMLLSTIFGEFEGDTYFPEFDESQWEVQRREEHEGWEFVHWVRQK